MKLEMTGKELPLVSICTGCYNHEKYLADYFEGILNQTYPNIELIISDDVSKDNSRKIIEEYLPRLKERFTRVLYIPHETNVGLVRNYHNLNSQAMGKYIKPFASDDIMLPEYVEVAVKYMEEHPEYAMGYSDAYQVLDSYRYGDSLEDCPLVLEPSYRKEGFGLFEPMLERQFMITAGMLFKRDIYIKHPYDLNIAIEDQDFWLTTARNEEGIGYIPETCVCYRKSATSMSDLAAGNAKAKFHFSYEATTKMYEKQLAYIEEEKRSHIWILYYKRYWDRAMDYGLKEEAKEMWRLLKKEHAEFTKREKTKWFFFKIGILKPVRNFKRFLRERKKK